MSDEQLAREQFSALFHQFYPALCNFVVRYVRSGAIAEELVQDLFLRLWERREEWGETIPSRAYLYRAARNRAFDHLKHVRITGRELIDPSMHTFDLPDAEVELEDLRTALHRAIERLPPRSREVFVLAKQHGLTYLQISEALSLSVKTVENHMSRAFRLLRKSLSPQL